MDRRARRVGGSCRSAFLLNYTGSDRGSHQSKLLQGAAVARAIAFYRVQFSTKNTPRAIEIQRANLPTEFTRAQLLAPTDPLFGYTTVDVRKSSPYFVPADCMGPPVGLVRNPRIGAPLYNHWVIETHWSDKHRFHLDL